MGRRERDERKGSANWEVGENWGGCPVSPAGIVTFTFTIESSPSLRQPSTHPKTTTKTFRSLCNAATRTRRNVVR